MSFLRIAWRNMQQRALASALTAISMGLGVALVVAVLVVHDVVRQSFKRGGEGYDLIIGKQGSPLQLVLNSAYYIGEPVGNIPYDYYKEFTEGRYAFDVKTAVPLAMGHSYQGFRVIGTNSDMFDFLTYRDDKHYEFAEGRNFHATAPYEGVVGWHVAKETGLKVGDDFKAIHGVVGQGATVHGHSFTVVGILKPTGTPNDRALFVNMDGFHLIHAEEAADARVPAGPQLPGAEEANLPEEGQSEHSEAPSKAHVDEPDVTHAEEHPATSADHDEAEHAEIDHDHSAHDGAPHDDEALDDEGERHDGHVHDEDMHPEEGDEGHAHAESEGHSDDVAHVHGPDCDHGHEEEINAILVTIKQTGIGLTDDVARERVANDVNRSNIAQAAVPAKEIARLFERFVGNIQWVLLFMAILIVVVAGLGIMVSIYNSMNDRRHDIAIMRALGASRYTVMVVILLESILLSLSGGAIGLFLGHGLIGILSPWIVEQTGVAVGLFQFRWMELVLIPGLIALASIVGYIPALSAYRTDVAQSLKTTP